MIDIGRLIRRIRSELTRRGCIMVCKCDVKVVSQENKVITLEKEVFEYKEWDEYTLVNIFCDEFLEGKYGDVYVRENMDISLGEEDGIEYAVISVRPSVQVHRKKRKHNKR